MCPNNNHYLTAAVSGCGPNSAAFLGLSSLLCSRSNGACVYVSDCGFLRRGHCISSGRLAWNDGPEYNRRLASLVCSRYCFYTSANLVACRAIWTASVHATDSSIPTKVFLPIWRGTASVAIVGRATTILTPVLIRSTLT